MHTYEFAAAGLAPCCAGQGILPSCNVHATPYEHNALMMHGHMALSHGLTHTQCTRAH